MRDARVRDMMGAQTRSKLLFSRLCAAHYHVTLK